MITLRLFICSFLMTGAIPNKNIGYRRDIMRLFSYETVLLWNIKPCIMATALK